MCGIVGIFSKTPLSDQDVLLRMRDTMIHRGPDDAGVWWSMDKCLGLAHRRLSIIDISPGGHQPMEDSGGQNVIVYNGEIYNYHELREELLRAGHVFRSNSDTEVLLAAYRQWGTECLEHLNGMFSFCLCDQTKRFLFLARDRTGEKPLFYTYENGRFTFASELKALIADPEQPRRLDFEGFEFYLAYGHIPGERCILKGVKKLPPAHAMMLDFNFQELRVWQYWHMPPPSVDDSVSMDVLLENLETLLQDSVKQRLAADVPVGVLLSGGIDSSLVTAFSAQTSSFPVRTFTITFPSHGAYDEGPHARIVAEHFGTRHTELSVEPASVELLPKLARQFDEPMCDSSMVPTYLLSHMIRQHCTVAVGGDGADELFGGYFNHQWLMYQARLRTFLPLSARQLLQKVGSLLPVGFRGRNGMLAMQGGLVDSMTVSGLFFDLKSRERLLRDHITRDCHGMVPEAYKAGLCEINRGLPGFAMAADFKMYLPEDILVKIDRASMLNSLEIRAPFLDHHIVEFAFGVVPNHFRATIKERKILLRRLASRFLPKKYDLYRPKRGFSLPLRAWFKGNWGDYIENILAEADRELFEQKTIQKLLTGQRLGYNNGERLFALAMFELWRREYGVGF
jgi:asparagine synthase (glutamine-hydrolysing)